MIGSLFYVSAVHYVFDVEILPAAMVNCTV